MSTIKSLSKQFKCSIRDVKEAARQCNFRALSDEHQIPEEKAAQIERVLSGFVQKSQSTNQAPAVSKSPVRITPSVPVSPSVQTTKDIETKELLGRDYIVFTLTAMERPGFSEVLRQIMDIKSIKDRIIVVSGAIDELKRDADLEKEENRALFLKNNNQLVEAMRAKGWLRILDGTVAEEGVTIGKYIRNNLKPENSILVLGKNMSLNTCVFNMNEAKVLKLKDGRWVKKTDGINSNKSLYQFKNYRYQKTYVPVEECSFSSKGVLFRIDENPVFGPDINDKYKYIEGKKYSVSVQVTDLEEDVIAINGEIPGVGSTVYTYNNGEWNSIKLQTLLHKGGAEGGIYTIDDAMLCAKILKADCITKRKMKKLHILCDGYKYMRGRDNSVIRRIAWPQEMLYASQDQSQPVGYIMRKFNDVKGFDTIEPDEYGDFVNNEKENQVVAAISLTELVRFLHENNVILCDINRGNILFDKNQRAYLVDLDSAQVTDPKPNRLDEQNYIAHYTCYPANVATPQFLSPEHVFDKTYTFVHSKKDDVWCLQYMIFLLLTMCGAYLPFENDATSDEGKQDIATGKYLYPKSYNSSQPISEDDPLYYMHCILSRLPMELRVAFFNSFSCEGTRFNVDKRHEAKVWMRWLVKYYESLPRRIKRDSENGVFLPNTVCYESDEENATIDHDGLGKSLDDLDQIMRIINK